MQKYEMIGAEDDSDDCVMLDEVKVPQRRQRERVHRQQQQDPSEVVDLT